MIALERAAEELKLQPGTKLTGLRSFRASKTVFRAALCDRFGLSAAEAEGLCDSLEQAKLIRFEWTMSEGARA